MTPTLDERALRSLLDEWGLSNDEAPYVRKTSAFAFRRLSLAAHDFRSAVLSEVRQTRVGRWVLGRLEAR